VCKMFVENDNLTSPYSGKTCQNWFHLTDSAKSDFDNNFSSLTDTLENSTLCKDPSAEGVLWCYVSNYDKSMRDPCFLHRKYYKYMSYYVSRNCLPNFLGEISLCLRRLFVMWQTKKLYRRNRSVPSLVVHITSTFCFTAQKGRQS
jgi:hypothetical protein